MTRWTTMCLLALTVCLSGCKPGAEKLTGTVTYRERMALPAGAVIKIAVEDVSRADSPAKVIGSTEIKPAGRQVPIPFEFSLMDPKAIEAGHRYTLRARIESADGTLMFINDTSYPVITNGVTHADMVLKRVAAN